ncbi:MAG: calcium/sodium antiporter [Ruminiclostridium sp.]|nr:calcium/sodium antiporter [Ruminiclostridium sp.]
MDLTGFLVEYVETSFGGVAVILLSVVLLVLGFIMLIKGADLFVENASKFAVMLKVPLIVIGLTIVAFGTSAPEAAISITSVCQSDAAAGAGISIGNVIGSNIMNILIILGISALFAVLPVKKETFRYEIPFVIFITVVLLLLGLDGDIGKLDAVILLILFAAFFVYLIILSKKGDASGADEVAELTEKDTVLSMTIFVLIGLVMIVVGSDFTVAGATKIAEALGVDSRLIGLTVVAFGTSLPELVTCVTAAKKNAVDIAIGNIIGSNIFNILFVAGLAGLVAPTPIGFQPSFIIDACVAIFAAVLLFLCVLKDRKLGRVGGAIMIGSYAVYFVYLILQPMILATA